MTTNIVIISEPSGRQFIAECSDGIINEQGFAVIKNPLMFAEQKGMDPSTGGMQVQIMMMPPIMSEFIDEITLIPSSWYFIPAHSKLAVQYREQWNEYESVARANSAGIITARSMPKGPSLVAPNGRS